MLNTIWKFSLKVTDNIEVMMPSESHILTVQMQNDQLCMWAAVNSNAQITVRRFKIYGTGHQLGPSEEDYIATFQMNGGSLVFHLFEVNMPHIS